jgi:purine/pyrimidine-nucleoside phosphorylase
MKQAETEVDRLAGVSVLKKANVYFDGRCVSHTVYVGSGARKSLGVILPGTLDFETASPERMEIVAGRCRVRLVGGEATHEYGPGQEFSVPANSGFRIEALEPLHYVCHFG